MSSVFDFSNFNCLETPILLLIFNRLDTTQKVFERIRDAKPKKLYIACDGPRNKDLGDNEVVSRVRAYVTQNVDWDCEVYKLFRDVNLGCKYSPSRAITWFFEHETQGIILEDDCLPSRSFFGYCEFMLNNFKDDKHVWHINGNNFGCPEKFYGDLDFVYNTLPQVWGWATWKDRWDKYTDNPFYVDLNKQVQNWSLGIIPKMCKLAQIEKLKSGLDAWDYQWQIKVLDHGGKSISPKCNLISNIGDGQDATHTKFDTRTGKKIEECWQIHRDLVFGDSKKVNTWYEQNMGLCSKKNALRYLIGRTKKNVRRFCKNFIISCISSRPKPVIVASSGRSGSTMLYEAICRNFSENVRILGFNIPKILSSRLGFIFLERLKILENKNLKFLVAKTHDLPNSRLCDNINFIFVYGDPLESALSVSKVINNNGDIWLDEHLFHLNSSGYRDQLFTRDVLNFEAQVRSWTSLSNDNVLCLHFSEIWKKEALLSEFLGFNLNLPEKKDRSRKDLAGNIDTHLYERLRKIEQNALKKSQKNDTYTRK